MQHAVSAAKLDQPVTGSAEGTWQVGTDRRTEETDMQNGLPVHWICQNSTSLCGPGMGQTTFPAWAQAPGRGSALQSPSPGAKGMAGSGQAWAAGMYRGVQARAQKESLPPQAGQVTAAGFSEPAPNSQVSREQPQPARAGCCWPAHPGQVPTAGRSPCLAGCWLTCSPAHRGTSPAPLPSGNRHHHLKDP